MDEKRKEQIEELKVKGSEIIEVVKKILHEGNVRRVIIKDEEDNTVLEIPISVGIIGAIVAPVLAAIGGIAALAKSYKIQIIRKEEDDKE